MESWGYKLRKAHGLQRKQWQRRYFRFDEGSSEMQYLHAPHDLAERGSILVAAITRLSAMDESTLGSHKVAKDHGETGALDVHTADRVYHLIFEGGSGVRDSWVLALWRAVDQRVCRLHPSFTSLPGMTAATLPRAAAPASVDFKTFDSAPPRGDGGSRTNTGASAAATAGVASADAGSGGALRATSSSRNFVVDLDSNDDEADAILLSDAGAGAESSPKRSGFLGGLFSRGVGDEEKGGDGVGRRGGGDTGVRRVSRPEGGEGRGRGRGRGAPGASPGGRTGIELQTMRGSAGRRGAPRGRGRGTPSRAGRGGLAQRLIDSDDESDDGDEDSDSDDDDDTDSDDTDSDTDEKSKCCTIA